VSQWDVLPFVLMVVGLARWSAGLWGYSGALLASTRSHLTNNDRIPKPPNARRLRGPETLDGDHDEITYITVVLSRSGVVGPGLPAFDGIS
jgi:hypothetical protein